MSTKAQTILDEIRALPLADQHDLLRKLEQGIGKTVLPESPELYGEPLTDQDIEESARVNFQMLDEEEDRAESR